MPASDALGDRMKLYEQMGAGSQMMPLLPVMARIDGRCFSGFTRGLARPFDQNLVNLMIDTTAYLVDKTNAVMGYTQSDEISLCFYSEDPGSSIFFDGKQAKITSALAAMATVIFNRYVCEQLGVTYANKMPTFDARVWNVPTKEEAINCFMWREWDATKNSISMAARNYYSAKQLHQKNGKEMQEMLFQKGVNWNDYPAHFKRGTYVRRTKVLRPFTADEIDKLPPKHQAHRDPDLMVERKTISTMDMPPLARVTNRVAVFFEGKDPETNATPDLLPDPVTDNCPYPGVQGQD